MARSITRITLATLLAAVAVHAQDSDQTILGCVDVGCPPSTQNSADDNCTVADRSFPSVGVTRVPTTNEALSGLAWTKGFNISATPEGNRTFGSSFYLDIPAAFLLNDTRACAIFFHGASQFLSFDNRDTPAPTNETTQGTCGDAMGSACVDALTKRARDIRASDGVSDKEACDKLREDFEKNMDDACLPISKESWSDSTSVALSGSDTPALIAGQRNASSTCWPAIEKQDNLTLVTDHQVLGSTLLDDAYLAQFAITPILTVFYPVGEESSINATEASLTCIKVMGPPRASLDTMNNGTADVDGAAAPGLSISTSYVSILAVLITSFMAFIL